MASKKNRAPVEPRPPEPPRVSMTVIDPLDLAVTVAEMDRTRLRFVKLLRDVGTDLLRIADLTEKNGLDADPGEMFGVSSYTLNELSRGFVTLPGQGTILRGVLGWSGQGHAIDKLEQHPQVIEALKLYNVRGR